MGRLIARLAALVMALAAKAGGAAGTSPPVFAVELVNGLRDRHPGLIVTQDPDDPLHLAIATTDGDQDGSINLHRLYRFCQLSSARECREAKAEFIEEFPLQNHVFTPDSLRLTVRDADFMDDVRSTELPMPIHEQIGEDLYAVLASEGLATIAYVSEKALAEMDLARADAWARAGRQTRARIRPLPEAARLRKEAMLFEGQLFGGAMLIDRAAWAELARAVGPDLFVTVVADTAVVVGTLPDKALAHFSEAVAEDCAAHERCISPHIYRFRDGHWVIAR